MGHWYLKRNPDILGWKIVLLLVGETSAVSVIHCQYTSSPAIQLLGLEGDPIICRSLIAFFLLLFGSVIILPFEGTLCDLGNHANTGTVNGFRVVTNKCVCVIEMSLS